MKQLFLIFNFMVLVSLSCKKDVAINELKPQPNIIYKDIHPDDSITTIKYYYYPASIWPQPCEYAIPGDSSVNYEFDLNDDSVNDFKIQIQHYHLSYYPFCGHCEYSLINSAYIIPLSSNDSVSLDTVSKYWARSYGSSEFITTTNIWSNKSTIVLLMGCFLPFNVNFEDTYLGLKVNNMIGWINISRISKNGILIKEHALSTRSYAPIKAGQKK